MGLHNIILVISIFLIVINAQQYYVSELYYYDINHPISNCSAPPVMSTIQITGKCLNSLIAYCDFTNSQLTLASYSDAACQTFLRNNTQTYNQSNCFGATKIYCSETLPSYSFTSYKISTWLQNKCGSINNPDQQVINRIGACLPSIPAEMYSNCGSLVQFENQNCTDVTKVISIPKAGLNTCITVNGESDIVTCNGPSSNSATFFLNTTTLILVLLYMYSIFY